jgi:tripartite-type tricarboxylate transporter receptor subunit TctC
MNKIIRAFAATMAGWFAALPMAQAQTYPNHPIELIVPLAPGSTTDAAARLLAKRVSETIGQQIVIENKVGAGIMVGSALVAKAPADGYTLLMGTVGLAVDSNLKAVPYDAEKDFAPISLVINSPMVMLVNPKLGVKTLPNFLAKYKNAPEMTFASGGTGTYPHLTGEIFKFKSGIPMRHVPYRGGGPALNDVIAGHVDLMFGTPVTKQNIEVGDVNALAVGAPQRLEVLPDVPTFAEGGLPIPEIDAGAWFGLFAPAGTPKDVIAKLNQHFNDALKDPTVRKSLLPIGLVPRGTTPEEFATFLHEEVVRWSVIVKQANIKGE